MRSGDQNRGFLLFWVCNFLFHAGCMLVRIDQNVINLLCAGPLLTCVPSLVYQHLQLFFCKAVLCSVNVQPILLHGSYSSLVVWIGICLQLFCQPSSPGSWRFTEWQTALSFSLLTCPSEFNVIEECLTLRNECTYSVELGSSFIFIWSFDINYV